MRNAPQLVLVLIAQLLEERSRGLSRGGFVVDDPVHVQMVRDDICNRLGVGRRTGSAAPDGVVNLGQLVRHSIRDVCSGRRSAVCAQDDSVSEGDCHAARG